MARVIDLNVLLCVGDNDILVEDNSSTKAVVGTYDDERLVVLTMGTPDGKRTFLLNKKFAKDLAKALEEKSK